MKLKQARVQSGMSQEELANRVHLSVSMIQSIENGRRDGSTKTLIALAAALNTTPNDLLYGINNTFSTSKRNPVQREETAR